MLSDYIRTEKIQYAGSDNFILSACFPKNMRIRYRSTYLVNLFFDLGNVTNVAFGRFGSLTYPGQA